MYKNFTAIICGARSCFSPKFIRVMKLTIVLWVVAFMQVSASTYAQKVTLNVQNASLDQVLNSLSQQSGYNFLYNSGMMKTAKPVSLTANNEPIQNVLEKCFINQPLDYVVNGNTVVIKKKDLTQAIVQDITVSGVVTDSKGEPLPGVTVTLKGVKKVTITDVNGRYSISVPDGNQTLVFSSIGFATQELPVNSRTQLNVTLAESATALSQVEVVSIGYGTARRGDLSGAISSVKAADIANTPQISIDQLLQGKAAGVTITQNSGGPGSATSVRIRGITSLSLSNEPLYIIDGVPVSGDANNRSSGGRSTQLSGNNGETGASPLSYLNPSDIESVDVLKDASASAIYGSRAANGVILITTKRGKNGSFKVGYDGYYGFQEQGKFLPMLNLKQYARLQNALSDIIGTSRRGEFANPELLGQGTDWQDEIFKNATYQSHQFSFSGAKEGTDYYISTGYANQDGTVLGNNFKRYNIRTNVNSQIKPWLKVGTTMSGAYSFQNTSLSNNTGIIYTALLSAPDQVVYNADGSFSGPLEGQIGAQNNPVQQALSITNTLARYNVQGSFYAEIKLYKDLTLRSSASGDLNFSFAKLFRPTYNNGPLYSNPTATLQNYNSNSYYWTWQEYLTYNHTFNKKHVVTGTLGHELINNRYNDNSAGVQNFLSNNLPALGLGDPKTATIGELIGATNVLESEFVRGIYTYNNKYSFTGTFRIDRSSKFAQGHQTGYFPSFAGFWRLSEEPFWAPLKPLADNVKLRLGYGFLGNQDVPNYLYGSALNAVPTGLGNGFAIDKVANELLTWESSRQSNIGLDFSLFNGRIESSLDVWQKTAKNFLFQAPLPAFLLGQTAEYSGTGVISPPYRNGGNLKSNGIDLTISTKNIVGKKFTWNSNFILSQYKTKVGSLLDGVPFISQNVTTSFLNLPVTRTQVGSAVGEFYGYKVKDIFRTADQLRSAPIQFGRPVASGSGGTFLGDIQYQDVNNDGKIDEGDQTFIGNPNPKFTYGITNNFVYKSFDLNIFLNGSYGAKIFNVLNYQIASLGSLYQNQVAYAANFWTPTNTATNVPRPVAGDNPNLKNSDRFVESGSFLRLQTVSLGYTLPAKLAKRAMLNRLRVYVTGQNLYVFTPYKGLDPEIGSVNQNVFLSNVDLGRYPIPRTLVFGINAEF